VLVRPGGLGTSSAQEPFDLKFEATTYGNSGSDKRDLAGGATKQLVRAWLPDGHQRVDQRSGCTGGQKGTGIDVEITVLVASLLPCVFIGAQACDVH
jgi:hypothetical protein